MPSHSLRFAGATPTEGTKVVTDLGHNCAQANPNTGRNFALHFSEMVADFCTKIFGNGGGFFRTVGGFWAKKNNGLPGGFYLFARRKFKEVVTMEEIKISKITLAIALAKDDVRRFFVSKHHDLMEEVSVK